MSNQGEMHRIARFSTLNWMREEDSTDEIQVDSNEVDIIS